MSLKKTKDSVEPKLYRLNVLEDETKGLVKISYVGYGSEWKKKEDVVDLEDIKDDSETVEELEALSTPPMMQPLNLYEVLAANII